MLSWIAYYFFIFPASLLPLRIIYLFTDVFYLLLITVFPYRRSVIRQNIDRSFPEKTTKEKRKIERKFYHFLTDLLAEGTKNLSISKKELQQRFMVRNPEVLDELYAQKKNTILVSGHFNNWEWLITALNLLFKHQAVGVGMPLTNGFWDRTLNARRSRFGMKVIHAKIIREFYEKNRDITANLVLADQSPGNSLKCYWTTFLNQQTGVFFGPELLANQYDLAVVYFTIHKVKRGYYEMELKEITRNPKQLEWGVITEEHTRLLENAIQKEPSRWLWSHKRWKREVPENLEQLKMDQKAAFDKKFRYV